jgi:hypothetical protein
MKHFLVLLFVALLGFSTATLRATESTSVNRPAPALKFKDIASGQAVDLARP